MRTALRTAVATAVVAGVAITPALTAGAAFAATPAPAATSTTGTTATDAAKADSPATGTPKATAGTTAPAATAPAAKATATTAPKTTAPATTAPATAAPATGTYVRTVALANGDQAKIFKVSAAHYRAEVVRQGERVGTVDAAGEAAVGKWGDMYVVLFPNGEAYSWKGNRTPVRAATGTYELANGARVELTEKSGRHVLTGNGELLAVVSGVRQVARFGGNVIVMDVDGGFAAYVPGSARQAAPKLLTASGYVRTVALPTGGEARIHRVSEGHHRAELFYKGRNVGTLDADHWSVAANNNGAFFVLNADGSTHGWVGNYIHAKPGQYKLANGVRLEVVEKDGRWGLQQIRLGHGTGVSYVKGDRTVYRFTGGGLVVLEQGGGLAAYIPGSARQSAPVPYTRDDQCTVTTTVSIGAGTEAELTMSPNGPTATFHDAGDDTPVFSKLDRKHPALPKDAGIIARIDNPFGATPTLYTKVEGGVGSKGGSQAFPKLPKGCTLNPVTGGTTVPTGNNGNTGTSGNTSNTGNTGSTGTTGGQTSVVPQGGVAAGAELGTSDTDSTVLYATGAGAASLAAAGLGFVVLRRRAGARG
ncbi:hypothetical protein AB0G79_33170 [Streptomyces sp. NPDC020807]|uniref:hypothetical protein n=1 Tax=Streptomyces sp. NPDC020807 TaxID=3155119 RepID=UPI0033D9329C